MHGNFKSALTRRELLSVLGSLPVLGAATGCGSDEPTGRRTGFGPWPGLDVAQSRFGYWRLDDGVPVFVYDADHEALPGVEWDRFILTPTKRHFILVGNRAISLEVIAAAGVDRNEMIERGSSVLNSAMAAWVLDVYSGLAARLGQTAVAEEAKREAAALRDLVRQAYNGSWFHRAYAPDGKPVGDSECWLEVQPWAILCGAADDRQARRLLELIRDRHSGGSPLGARVIWPVALRANKRLGEGIDSGIWFSINMTLVWAAARLLPELAWSEWRKMTLLSHTAQYPEIWEGTLSGPDAYNAPESSRPGRTWEVEGFAMQSYPVNNLHSHSQPLLGYLRLLGVEPGANGELRVAGGGAFQSRTFQLEEDGSGRLEALGPVVVETPRGTVRGGPGSVSF